MSADPYHAGEAVPPDDPRPAPALHAVADLPTDPPASPSVPHRDPLPDQAGYVVIVGTVGLGIGAGTLLRVLAVSPVTVAVAAGVLLVLAALVAATLSSLEE